MGRAGGRGLLARTGEYPGTTARSRAAVSVAAGRGGEPRLCAAAAEEAAAEADRLARAGGPHPRARWRRPSRTWRSSGVPTERLPHLVTFSCLYVDGEALLHALDRRGFAVSSGSSCTSCTLRPSHVLEAMGVLSHGNVRVSLNRSTTPADVDRFLAELPGVVADLRAEAGVVGL